MILPAPKFLELAMVAGLKCFFNEVYADLIAAFFLFIELAVVSLLLLLSKYCYFACMKCCF